MQNEPLLFHTVRRAEEEQVSVVPSFLLKLEFNKKKFKEAIREKYEDDEWDDDSRIGKFE